MNDTAPQPWYRQFWPWFIMALPASAVIAGIATVIIAVKNPDGLVEDDYYKAGLAINRDLARSERAAARGLAARVEWDAATQTIRLELTGDGPLPERLRLRLVHPTRAGLDRDVPLLRQPDGRYLGSLARAPEPGNWHLLLAPLDAQWRIRGRVTLPGTTEWRLAP
ncbi:MAG TPA: hypothetical protein ENI93_04840 [Gammaproteobacteria bacterium]|nr:hypothetical protein [Gammaproteobacteria bacterium]